MVKTKNFVGREKKVQGVFLPLCFPAAPRGLKNLKRKDSECRLAKRVCSGGFRVEGFLTSAGAWG
jgi:hypothetical protein